MGSGNRNRVAAIVFLAALGVAISGWCGVTYATDTQEQTVNDSSDSPSEMTILVSDFMNETGSTEYDNIGVALGIYVSDKLTRVSSIQVVTEDARRAALSEQQLSISGFIDENDAVEVGLLAGATHVVRGTYTLVDDKLVAGASVVDVVTGVQVCTAASTASCDETGILICEMSNQILAGLGVDATETELEAVSMKDTGTTVDSLRYRGDFERNLYDASGMIKERFTVEEIRHLKDLCARILAIENKNIQVIALRRFILKLRAETASRG